MFARDIIFKILYGRRGYPRELGTMEFSFDVSLRRWNFDGEVEVREAMEQEIPTGSLAVDVGANFGMHTLIMANQVGEQGHVVACEPIPANLKLLRRNVRLNQFDQRVSVLASAISDLGTPTLHMTLDSDALEPSAAISHQSSTSQLQVEVQNQTLDQALANADRFKHCFIKIDVEGAELSVLRSSEQTLITRKPTLLIEVHDYALPSFAASTEEVYAFLSERGFSIKQLSDMSNHNGQYHHILAKPSESA